mgnify:CR=1 FL=1
MKYLDLLWTSIAELRSREEVKNFFKDLLSESEAIMLARRITIAKYLLENKSYDEINYLMSASHTTIATVHRWLSSGFNGYETAIKKFNKAMNKRRSSGVANRPEPYTFGWLKKKYPLHFLLFNIFDELKKK